MWKDSHERNDETLNQADMAIKSTEWLIKEYEKLDDEIAQTGDEKLEHKHDELLARVKREMTNLCKLQRKVNLIIGGQF